VPQEAVTPRTEGSLTPLTVSGHDAYEDGIDTERPSNGGLSSCKRMHDSYKIVSQNDVERQGGLQEAYFTVSDFVNAFLSSLN